MEVTVKMNTKTCKVQKFCDLESYVKVTTKVCKYSIKTKASLFQSQMFIYLL